MAEAKDKGNLVISHKIFAGIVCIILLLGSRLEAQLLNRPNFDNAAEKLQFVPFDAVINYLPVQRVNDISEDQAYFYLATEAGIWRFHKYDDFWDFPLTNAQGLPENSIQSIYYWPDGDLLYVSTPRYHAVYNATWQEWLSFEKSYANPVWPGGYRLDDFLPAMHASKAERIKRVNDLPRAATLATDRSFSMRADGVLVSQWGEEFPLIFAYESFFGDDIIFTIANFGVGIGSNFDVAIDLYRLSVPPVPLTDLLISGENFWFAGEARPSAYGAIAKWPGINTTWYHYYKQNSSAFAFSFSAQRLLEHSGAIYAATDNGILQYIPGNNEWLTLKGTANKAFSDIERMAMWQGRLWLGTEDGLIAYDKGLGAFAERKNPFQNTRIYDVIAHRQQLFVATIGGVFLWQQPSAQPQSLNYLSSLVGGTPLVLAAVEDELFIGTEEGYIWYNEKEKSWNSMPLSRLRIAGPVRDIAFNHRDAFFLVPVGVIHWQRKKDYFRLINGQSGLPGNAGRRLILDGDALWIVQSEGVAQVFYMDLTY
jgi:hypothetical protein